MFIKELTNSDIGVWESESVSVSLDKFNIVLRELLNKNATKQTSSITIRGIIPWYNDDIRESKRIRRRTERALYLLNISKSTYYIERI